MSTLLETFAITKRYGSRVVVQPTSLRVLAGGYYGLLGPNGAGKTTTLHMMVGLLEPSAGEVVVGDYGIHDRRSRNHLGYAPDDLPLPGALTGAEFLQLHDRMRRRDDSEQADRLSRLFGIDSVLNRQIDEYSHGMRRKLQLTAAVMHQPDVILLDEPFRGLDPRSSLLLRRFLSGYAEAGRAVVVATHDLVRAERDCSWLWLIDQGAVAESAPPSDILRRAGAPDLETAFSVLTTSDRSGFDEQSLLDASLHRTPPTSPLEGPLP